ncbi:hypothetical protein INT43_000258 [Umbelopsis isabellina]|uniref:Uncharacterized protein n=1 Tax=Mortierella isabellina TaxID=91625 RepID=A0A8H7PFE6_MORIS|nr:hypothetical protein INT43_000258 [Umbelopsis isabellina]
MQATENDSLPKESEALLTSQGDEELDESISLLDDTDAKHTEDIIETKDVKQTEDTKLPDIDTNMSVTPHSPSAQANLSGELSPVRRIPAKPLLHFDTTDNIHQMEQDLANRQYGLGGGSAGAEDDDDDAVLVNAIPSTIGGSLDKFIGTVMRGIGYVTRDQELVNHGQTRIAIGTAEIEQKKREKVEATKETVATQY